MMWPAAKTASGTTVGAGIEDLLEELVRRAFRDSPDVMSIAVGDRPDGILTILGCGDSDMTLVAQPKQTANLGVAPVIPQRLAQWIGMVLPASRRHVSP